MSEERPEHEREQQHRKRKRHKDENSRTHYHLGALGDDSFRLLADSQGLADALGGSRQPFALLRKNLGLPLERESLTFQLQTLAVADLLQEANDSLGVFVVHRALTSQANRRRADGAQTAGEVSALSERLGVSRAVMCARLFKVFFLH